MPKYFGTDGVRAVAGQFPLVEDFIVKLGFCALKEIGNALPPGAKKQVLMAEDSRTSGPQIAQYLTRGILAAGFDVLHLGVAPTPAISYLTQKCNCACGVVISASHNPAEFNGIKFFSSKGTKLGEEIESAIEQAVESMPSLPSAKTQAVFKEDSSLLKSYADFLKNTLPAKTNFKGLKIVMDCANGATSKIAPQVFKDLGADIIVLADAPNGANINDGVGALHTETMQNKVKETGAFMGLSFDGDGDRLIASDEQGGYFDGDNIIASAALYLKGKGELKASKAVLTVMANLGLINFLKSSGITPLLTQVGDKYVFEALEEGGLSLGGETSGHIIFKNLANTGDGILCALQLVNLIKESGKAASWHKNCWSRYPLKLIPVKVVKKIPLEEIEGFNSYVKELEDSMGEKGRILVRYSGTEPLLRILVEGEDKAQVEDYAQKVAVYYKSKTEDKNLCK